jgi:hypothetical protein
MPTSCIPRSGDSSGPAEPAARPPPLAVDGGPQPRPRQQLIGDTRDHAVHLPVVPGSGLLRAPAAEG